MPSRREFIKLGVTAAAGVAAASVVELPILNNQAQQKQQQIDQLQSRANDLSGTLGQVTGFLTLSPKEQVIVEAVAETMIPTDDSGPGAKEAGVIYFIDKQLAGNYGKSGNMYTQGPFVQANQKGPITVQGFAYPKGSGTARIGAGTRYQYPLTLREFWRVALQALEEYSSSAYGGDFETLTADGRTQVLKDLWANKPTSFRGLVPQDFFAEMHDMVVAGFLTDPLYGGNKGMVGWELMGHAGVNPGNFYGEGLNKKDLMVMDKPVRLKPASLAQLQQGNPK